MQENETIKILDQNLGRLKIVILYIKWTRSFWAWHKNLDIKKPSN